MHALRTKFIECSSTSFKRWLGFSQNVDQINPLLIQKQAYMRINILAQAKKKKTYDIYLDLGTYRALKNTPRTSRVQDQ